jgi:Islet cell autoantigen ICA69, C-terminal domain
MKKCFQTEILEIYKNFLFQDEYKDEVAETDKTADETTVPPIQPLMEAPSLLCDFNADRPAVVEKKTAEEKLLNLDELLDDDFDDFVSASTVKSFMPSQLLMHPEMSLLDDNDHGMQPTDPLLPVDQGKVAASGFKSTNAILELFNRQPKAASSSNGGGETSSPGGGDKKANASKGKDVAAWFQLFADLDPLANASRLDEVETNNHDSHAA